MATAKQIKIVMAALGKRKSDRKRASSRINGKLGGVKPSKFDAKNIARRAKYAQTRDSKAVE